MAALVCYSGRMTDQKTIVPRNVFVLMVMTIMLLYISISAGDGVLAVTLNAAAVTCNVAAAALAITANKKGQRK